MPTVSFTVRALRIANMSLRRSARVQAQPSTTTTSTPAAKGKATVAKKPITGKRKPKPTENIASRAIGQDGEIHDGGILEKAPVELSTAYDPTTATPNKRRRTAKDEEPTPFTPTPAAIAFMTKHTPVTKNYSSGDIDDATPPSETRPAEPNHTNATLLTPSGTQLEPSYSTFEDNASPSIPSGPPTNPTLLERACAHLVAVDPTAKLAPLIAKTPCRVFSPAGLAEEIDPFRSLSSGIIAQQVSGAAAKSIKTKFIALFPTTDCSNGFPTPAAVARTSLPKLREAGLSQRKAEYIRGLAEKFECGELTARMLMEGEDEDVRAKLVGVRGLGMWSVEMFMCFGLKRLDVLSVGDLGVERGMAAYVGRDVRKLKAKGGKRKYMSEKEMLEIAEKFSPYRYVFPFTSELLNESGCVTGLLTLFAGACLCGTCGESRRWMSTRYRTLSI